MDLRDIVIEKKAEIDGVGRIVMPEEFRDVLAKEEDLLLLTCYRPGFIILVPEKEFASSLASHERVAVDRWRVSGIAESRREVVRMYFSLSRPAEFDDDWSLVIPSPQREIAGLRREVLIVANRDRIEIWDPVARQAEEIDYDC
jgi:DNA-binding transcriptional regulator/RsmH inhibitor MraZ